MGQAVPLGAVLQMHDHQIVTDDIGAQRVVAPELVVHIGFFGAQGRPQNRRHAAGVEHIAPRKIQGQAQVEAQPVLHLCDALFDFLGREQIHPSALVVRAKVPPGGSFGALVPSV